jgi:hypothetical protein
MVGITTAQGYGAPHQQERARWARYQQAGGDEEPDGQRRGRLLCRADQCVMPDRWIERGEAWDLGHDRARRHRGPEHVRCNRRAGAIESNRTGNPGTRDSRPRRRRRRVGLAEVSVDVTEL